MHSARDLRSQEFQLDHRGQWTFRRPLGEIYRQQKGIELNGERPHLPDQQFKTNTNCLPESINWCCGADVAAGVRGHFVLRPQIEASLSGRAEGWPSIFPGRPLLGLELTGLDKNVVVPATLSYDQFVNMSALKQSAGKAAVHCCWPTPTMPVNKEKIAWPWKYLPPPDYQVVTSSQPGPPVPVEQIVDEIARLQEAGLQEVLPEKVLSIFRLIRKAWSGANQAEYEIDSLRLAGEILKAISGQWHSPLHLLPLFFELEKQSAYATLLGKMTYLGSGWFCGNWLDVGALPLCTIRGAEQCQPGRLLDELQNLYQGQTAPLLINEYGCVADGNHRLTAAWLWNLLGACGGCDWSLADDAFQRQITEAASSWINDKTSVPLMEALRCLGVLMAEFPSGCDLMAALRAPILASPILELPVSPLLEYGCLTVWADAFSQGRWLRFEPATYAALLDNPLAVLPARACYHFADLVPLPWFSFRKTSDHQHHGLKSGHRIDISPVKPRHSKKIKDGWLEVAPANPYMAPTGL